MAFCTNCGTKLLDTAAFCTNCGTRVPTYASAPAAAEVPVISETPIVPEVSVTAGPEAEIVPEILAAEELVNDLQPEAAEEDITESEEAAEEIPVEEEITAEENISEPEETAEDIPVEEDVPEIPVVPTIPVVPPAAPAAPAHNPAPAYVPGRAAPPAYRPAPYVPADAPPPAGKYGVVSTGIFFWLSVLYSIPIIGLLSCIVFCFAPKNTNIKNFSKAHVLRVVIAFLLSVLSIIAIGWLVVNLAEDFEYWLMENSDAFAMGIEDFIYNNFGEFV